jgi:4-amino-4-deoxy-L-arabinose transferase-like glycosyltransferase
MVALWIRVGTALAGQTAFGVRLAGPLAAALASWCLYDAGQRLFPGRRAGAMATVLMNATLLLGVGSVIMTPDSPLLFFWTLSLWAMVRLVAGGTGAWWLAAGLFAGLAIASKYTAVFLWVGIGLWLVLTPDGRIWLRRWQPWAAAALGCAVFSPVLAWNATHGWAGFLKQGSRIGDWQPMRAVGFLAELLGGQIGLVTPWIWVLCMAGLIAAARRAWTTRDAGWSLLTALSLPPLLVFIQHAIGDRVQGNWPAILYPALVIAAAGRAKPGRDSAWIGASALGFSITVIVYAQASLGLLPVPVRFDPIALRLTGWKGFATQADVLRREAGATFIVADGYATDSELAWWLATDATVVGTDARWALTALPPAAIAGETGLLLRDVRRREPPDPAVWEDARAAGTVMRAGAPFGFSAFVVRPVAGLAAVSLPRRD